MDQFTCSDDLNKIIEVIAKNRIFYHIVETDVIATKIINAMNRQNLSGTPNFIPLNRITMRIESESASGVIKKLTYNPKFTRVMHYIFGKVLICRDLDHALIKSKTRNTFRLVTVAGDLVEKFGAISGGYIPATALRMEAYQNWTHSRDAIDKLNDELATKRQGIVKLSDNISLLTLNYREINKQINEIETIVKCAKTNSAVLRRRIKTIHSRKTSKQDRLVALRTHLSDALAEKEQLENVLQQPLFSPEIQERIAKIDKTINDLLNTKKIIEKTMFDLTGKLNTIEQFSREKLMEKFQQISSSLKDFKESKNDLAKYELENAEIRMVLEATEQRLHEKNHLIEQFEDQRTEITQKMSVLLHAKTDFQQKLREVSMEITKTEIEKEKLENTINNSRAEFPAVEILNETNELYANSDPITVSKYLL